MVSTTRRFDFRLPGAMPPADLLDWFTIGWVATWIEFAGREIATVTLQWNDDGAAIEPSSIASIGARGMSLCANPAHSERCCR